MKKGRKKYKPKYPNGTRFAQTPDLSDMYNQQQKMSAQQNAAKGLITTGADMILPGVGSAINAVDSINKGLTNDKKYGVRKDDIGSRLAATYLNPMGTVNVLASGDKDVILDHFTFGLAGESALEKAKVAEAAAEKKAEADAFNKSLGAFDPTIHQRVAKYATGTDGVTKSKAIEVERDELVFRKVGGRFKLKADFKGGKSHARGGEDYVVQQGDVIFPGVMRDKVLKAYKADNHLSLETMRMQLPADTNNENQAMFGLNGNDDPNADWANIDWTKRPGYRRTQDGKHEFQDKYGRLYWVDPKTPIETTTVKATELPPLPVINKKADVLKKKVTKTVKGNPITTSVPIDDPRVNNPLLQNPTSMNRLPFGESKLGDFTDKVQAPEVQTSAAKNNIDLSGLMGLSGPIHNLMRSLEPVEKVSENYVKPELLKYQDRSNPLRKQSTMARNAQKANARRTSGGSKGNYLKNAQIASAEDFGRKQGIDTQEMQRADAVDNINVQTKNQADQINSQKKDIYDQLNAQNRAAKTAYGDQAMDDLNRFTQVRAMDKKLAKSDDLKMSLLNQMTNYGIDINDDKAVVKFLRSGSSGTSNANTTTTTSTTKYKKSGEEVSKVSKTTKPINWFNILSRKKRK